jgi:CrcB protein
LAVFLLAFIITAALEILELDSDLRLGVTTGLLGAFTTFSTLCKETAVLINGGFLLSAVLYILIATVLALFAVYYGTALARRIFAEKTADKKRDVSTGGGSGEGGGQ